MTYTLVYTDSWLKLLCCAGIPPLLIPIPSRSWITLCPFPFTQDSRGRNGNPESPFPLVRCRGQQVRDVFGSLTDKHLELLNFAAALLLCWPSVSLLCSLHSSTLFVPRRHNFILATKKLMNVTSLQDKLFTNIYWTLQLSFTMYLFTVFIVFCVLPMHSVTFWPTVVYNKALIDWLIDWLLLVRRTLFMPCLHLRY